jgi:FtsZ-binding cell division protein ZapB
LLQDENELLNEEIKELKDVNNELNKDVADLCFEVDKLTKQLHVLELQGQFWENQSRFDGTFDGNTNCSSWHGKGQGFGASSAVSMWASNGVDVQTPDDLERWESHVWSTLFQNDQAIGQAILTKVHTCYLRWSTTTVVGMDFQAFIDV